MKQLICRRQVRPALPGMYKTADSSPLAAAAGQGRNAESKQLVL